MRTQYVLYFRVNGHGFEDFFVENPDSLLRMVQVRKCIALKL